MDRLMAVFGLFLYIQLLMRPVDAGGYTSLSLALDYGKLFCRGNLPKHNYGLFTRNWRSRDKKFTHSDFTSLADLCSVHGNPRGNLGGIVRHPCSSGARLLLTLTRARQCTAAAQLYFDPTKAALVLLNDLVLRRSCRKNCFCIKDEDEYLIEDVKEAIKRKGMTPVSAMPRVTPFMRPPNTPPRALREFKSSNPAQERKPPPKSNAGSCRGSLISPVRVW